MKIRRFRTSDRRDAESNWFQGMTLAVEPMINIGRKDVYWKDDDWTVATEDGQYSAHYENTILITDGEPEILTLYRE